MMPDEEREQERRLAELVTTEISNGRCAKDREEHLRSLSTYLTNVNRNLDAYHSLVLRGSTVIKSITVPPGKMVVDKRLCALKYSLILLSFGPAELLFRQRDGKFRRGVSEIEPDAKEYRGIPEGNRMQQLLRVQGLTIDADSSRVITVSLWGSGCVALLLYREVAGC